MQLLMTADTVGGVWTYALELARALHPHGIRTALATMGALPSREQEDEASRVPDLQLIPGGFRLEWMDDPWDDVRAAGEWLLWLEECVRPDLIHLNGYVHGDLEWNAPALVVGHSCVLSWWQAVRGEPAPPHWDRYRREVARGLAAAAVVTAPSHAMLEALRAHYGPFRAAGAVPNGRRPHPFQAAEKEDYILAAGRLWDEAKNIQALETAAAGLDWPVYVAGDRRHPNGQIATHWNVRALGRLSPAELADTMGRASIYALPARYEPFGLSALEAGLAGCALVLGDLPSLREIWGDAALFVPPDDPEALRDALRWLIEAPEARRSLGAAARERAAAYTPERMARGYLSLYHRLLERPAAAATEAPPTMDTEVEEEEPACAW